jgi:Reverse transcriptase (RNA-dependent DNA polymerase)
MGYEHIEADHAVFVCRQNGVLSIIILYVDDITMTGNSLDVIDRDKEALKQCYQMTDLGEISWILGIHVTRDREAGWIALSQQKYIEEILERFGKSDVRPITTPAVANEHLVKLDSPEVNTKSYQGALGALMYLMLGTRPDLAYAVGTLSRYAANPGHDHQRALERVFRYLRGTCDYELTYRRGTDSGLTLYGFTDADWASDVNDRRSTSGYAFFLAGGAISWSSKKQTSITLSSTEAEYIAGTHGAKEAVWLRQFLEQIHFPPSSPTDMYMDNQSAIAIAKNPEFHDRTKHIDVCHHFLRKKVEDKQINLEYIPTNDQIADVLTKGLSREKHDKFMMGMGVHRPN